MATVQNHDDLQRVLELMIDDRAEYLARAWPLRNGEWDEGRSIAATGFAAGFIAGYGVGQANAEA